MLVKQGLVPQNNFGDFKEFWGRTLSRSELNLLSGEGENSAAYKDI